MRSVLILLLFSNQFVLGQQKGFYRTPAIHGQWVVFTAEGDLWKYDMSSGQTARLTDLPLIMAWNRNRSSARMESKLYLPVNSKAVLNYT